MKTCSLRIAMFNTCVLLYAFLTSAIFFIEMAQVSGRLLVRHTLVAATRLLANQCIYTVTVQCYVMMMFSPSIYCVPRY